MKLTKCTTAAIVLLLNAQLHVTAQSTSSNTNASTIINVNNGPTDPLSTTAWALIYTYPLAIFGNWIGGVLQHVPVNEIYHQRTLATPLGPGVVKPNEDTLYSRAVLELSSHDIVLTVPEIDGGRYWVFPVYDSCGFPQLDVFGNNVAEIGVVNGNKAGKYLIRRTEDTFTAPGYVDDNTSALGALVGIEVTDTYEGIVNVPTTYAAMLIRLLVKQNTTADLDAVHTFQNASSLTPIRRTTTVSPRPSLNSTAPEGGFLGIDTPAKQFAFAAKLVPYNQPENYSERYCVANILARAGLYSNQYTPVSGFNLTEAAVIANTSITADVQAPTHVRNEGNDWELQIPSYQINYGTHYAAAAYVALAGYQQQTIKQTLYPGYGSLGFTTTSHLADNTSLLYTFSGKPKVQNTGFWSLSVYGTDQYLIPNSLNRIEVGDRSYSLRYQDGSGAVYRPQANTSHDGPFQVLVQSAKSTPPANWTGNWLPAAQSFSQFL